MIKQKLKLEPRKTIAYIIVSWNNADLLEECIISINKQDYKYKKRIILVDNASSDNTPEYIEKEFSNVEVIREKTNHGFARGNNIGINKALEDGEVGYIVLLNTEARLETNWTSTLIEAASKRLKVACMQSITLDYYDPGVIDSTHLYISRRGQGT